MQEMFEFLFSVYFLHLRIFKISIDFCSLNNLSLLLPQFAPEVERTIV